MRSRWGRNGQTGTNHRLKPTPACWLGAPVKVFVFNTGPKRGSARSKLRPTLEGLGAIQLGPAGCWAYACATMNRVPSLCLQKPHQRQAGGGQQERPYQRDAPLAAGFSPEISPATQIS